MISNQYIVIFKLDPRQPSISRLKDREAGLNTRARTFYHLFFYYWHFEEGRRLLYPSGKVHWGDLGCLDKKIDRKKS